MASSPRSEVREATLDGSPVIVNRWNGIPFTEDLFTFSNSYFRLLLSHSEEPRRHLLTSDRFLTDDAEARMWVETYALYEEAFFSVFGGQDSSFNQSVLNSIELPFLLNGNNLPYTLPLSTNLGNPAPTPPPPVAQPPIPLNGPPVPLVVWYTVDQLEALSETWIWNAVA